ncbi:MAG TPA: translation initiation factor IF-1 [Chloroflexota bacterium]|nr:translation initiation factor IF-1 [Chloroflexota bacterium]
MRGRREPALEGTVVEALPHAMFAVALDDGRRITGHVAGPVANRTVRLNPGDRVVIELSPYDLSRGRIVKRLKE